MIDKNVDIVLLNESSESISMAAWKGELMIDRNPIMRSDFFERSWKLYADFKPKRDLLFREMYD